MKLKITGNLKKLITEKLKVATWYASGRIRVWDENSTYAMNQAPAGSRLTFLVV
jgi:hypothetical protein